MFSITWRSRAAVAGAVLALSAGTAFGAASDVPPSTTAERLIASQKEPHNWLTHHGSYSGHRYSTLNQINKRNVKNLKMTFTYALGGVEGGGIWPHGGLQGTPIVEDGFMYVTDGWGSVYKLDVREGRAKLVWKMDPKTEKDYAAAVTCCGVNNRGVGLWRDKVVSHTLDGRLIVTDKRSGEITFQRQVADVDVAEVITAAPLIVKNLAITGVAGAEYGIRGWVAATDLTTGQEVWRTHTVPAPGEPGSETWADSHGAWKNGGGSTWITGTYDPKLNLIFWGVGNPGPDWDNEFRPGDNLYTNSTIALDADTGKINWHYQFTPNDPYDYDGVNENLMVDTIIKGKQRSVVVRADRNGFAYAIDRTNGEFVWGTPFVDRVTWTRGLDPKTGIPLDYNPNSKVQRYALSSSRANPEQEVCPGNMGGKNWPPTAYNPVLNLFYIPVIESCNVMITEATEPGSWRPREFWIGGGLRQFEEIYGSVTAIDVATGKVAAKKKTKYPLLGGMLATRDLVFTVKPEGTIVALDARTLDELWSFETGAGTNAPPMTYSVNGKQYLAVLVGLGGAWPKWFVDSTPGLERLEPSSMLYVFAL
jgi:alcohol dehydrogenase (cytochrome c)